MGIDISSTTALSYTETLNTALLMNSETTNLGLEWDSAGVKTSLEITPFHMDLEFPASWDPMKTFTKWLWSKIPFNEENIKALVLAKDEVKMYANTNALKAIMLQTETWTNGIETTLNSGISDMDNEVGALKQNVRLGARFKSNINKIEARTNEVAAELVTTKQTVMNNVAQFDKSKGYILRASARLNELHA